LHGNGGFSTIYVIIAKPSTATMHLSAILGTPSKRKRHAGIETEL
jgi:hypothetical protein